MCIREQIVASLTVVTTVVTSHSSCAMIVLVNESDSDDDICLVHSANCSIRLLVLLAS